ncbi:MAG: putative ABC transporter ATP-binding protein YxlF [Anaerolineales bacterium]|nr:putative ABC transporter ATP-binding protein YxlF [Anaerolineales bacterium]
MSAIETTNLTKQFNGLTAVDQLELRIEPGTLYGFIGPNGAGKTTTLRLLAGLLEPDAGDIRLAGDDIQRHPEAARWLVGYMPDFFGVYDDMRVWEYLDFFGRCYNLPADRRARLVDELLALVDLDGKCDDYVENLSRGMRQRLCLAHALVHDPQILLLDEPASGLDPRARVEIRELLRELQRMGKTIIVSSHILSELAEMCDQVGIIEQGRLLVSGPMRDVRRHLRHERIIRLTVISDVEQARATLAKFKGIGEVFEVNGGLQATFTGDAEATAGLLAYLIHHNVKVTNFTEDVTDLEDVFLQITKGEVQ